MYVVIKLANLGKIMFHIFNKNDILEFEIILTDFSNANYFTFSVISQINFLLDKEPFKVSFNVFRTFLIQISFVILFLSPLAPPQKESCDQGNQVGPQVLWNAPFETHTCLNLSFYFS